FVAVSTDEPARPSSDSVSPYEPGRGASLVTQSPGRIQRSAGLRSPAGTRTTPNITIPITGSSGHHHFTPSGPTIPVGAITANPVLTVTAAASGFHVGGAERSSGRGSSKRPMIATVPPVITSSARHHSGRAAHQVLVRGSGSRARASRASSRCERPTRGAEVPQEPGHDPLVHEHGDEPQSRPAQQCRERALEEEHQPGLQHAEEGHGEAGGI